MRRAYARKSCSFALAILCAVLWLCYSPRLRKLLEESGMARLISIREEPQLLLGELGDDEPAAVAGRARPRAVALTELGAEGVATPGAGAREDAG